MLSRIFPDGLENDFSQPRGVWNGDGNGGVVIVSSQPESQGWPSGNSEFDQNGSSLLVETSIQDSPGGTPCIEQDGNLLVVESSIQGSLPVTPNSTQSTHRVAVESSVQDSPTTSLGFYAAQRIEHYGGNFSPPHSPQTSQIKPAFKRRLFKYDDDEETSDARMDFTNSDVTVGAPEPSSPSQDQSYHSNAMQDLPKFLPQINPYPHLNQFEHVGYDFPDEDLCEIFENGLDTKKIEWFQDYQTGEKEYRNYAVRVVDQTTMLPVGICVRGIESLSKCIPITIGYGERMEIFGDSIKAQLWENLKLLLQKEHSNPAIIKQKVNVVREFNGSKSANMMGTLLHHMIDKYVRNDREVWEPRSSSENRIHHDEFKLVTKFLDLLMNHDPRYFAFTELPVSDMETLVAGSIDAVHFNKGTRQWVIHDWKRYKDPSLAKMNAVRVRNEDDDADVYARVCDDLCPQIFDHDREIEIYKLTSVAKIPSATKVSLVQTTAYHYTMHLRTGILNVVNGSSGVRRTLERPRSSQFAYVNYFTNPTTLVDIANRVQILAVDLEMPLSAFDQMSLLDYVRSYLRLKREVLVTYPKYPSYIIPQGRMSDRRPTKQQRKANDQSTAAAAASATITPQTHTRKQPTNMTITREPSFSNSADDTFEGDFYNGVSMSEHMAREFRSIKTASKYQEIIERRRMRESRQADKKRRDDEKRREREIREAREEARRLEDENRRMLSERHRRADKLKSDSGMGKFRIDQDGWIVKSTSEDEQ